MKKYHFFVIAGLLVMILVSCDKSPKLAVSPKEVTFDAYPEEEQTIDISANVAWTATVKQTEEWLTIDPVQGKGDAVMTLTADENIEFTGRTALIIISGDGTQTDTIRVEQTAGIDVAEEIEDEIFRKYCLNAYDVSPRDGKLSMKEVRVKMLIIKEMGIKSLAGIEYFSHLENLDCSFNLLKTIDISKNKELVTLNCSYNPMTSIDVSENEKLTTLNLCGMGLTGIDVRQNTALRKLDILFNPLKSLDVSNNKNLDYLNCNETQLTTLDVHANTKLKTLSCINNQLTVLDVSKNVLLEIFYCDQNSLSNLDIRQNTELEVLTCAGNQLQSLDVSRNVKLTKMFCNRNNLTGSMNLTSNSKLEEFDFRNNPLLNTIIIWRGFQPNNDKHRIDSPPTNYQYQ